MDSIRDLARLSVTRAFCFASLAIFVTMSGLLWNLSLALRAGAAMYLILAVIMELKATFYHRKDIRNSEVWILLPAERRPDARKARPLIVATMRDELDEKAEYALWTSAVMLFTAVCLRLATE